MPLRWEEPAAVTLLWVVVVVLGAAAAAIPFGFGDRGVCFRLFGSAALPSA